MDFVKRYCIPDFEKHKQAIIMALDIVKETHDCQYAKMTASDYKVNYDNKPLYWNIVKELCQPFVDEYVAEWYCSRGELNHMWFAEYSDYGTFGWHTHEGCNMSCVLQVELDDTHNATQLLGIDFPLEEGDFVMFPAMMPHRSPVVKSGSGNKIVVGMNFDMFGSTLNTDE